MKDQYDNNQLKLFDQRISNLKERVSVESSHSKKHKEKRDSLNKKFSKLRKDILESKTERDRLNGEVKKLKQKREEIRAIIRLKSQEIKTKKSRIQSLRENEPQESLAILEARFDGIEWRIQTTTMSLEEEKKNVEKVRQIETQIAMHKKIKSLNKKNNALINELEDLKLEADSYHRELTELAQASQKNHAEMLNKIKESKIIKKEADKLHILFLEEKEKVIPIITEIQKLKEQRKKIRKKIYEEKKREKDKKEQELKEKIEAQTKEKLRRGEEINLKEFQLLSEDQPKQQTK